MYTSAHNYIPYQFLGRSSYETFRIILIQKVNLILITMSVKLLLLNIKRSIKELEDLDICQ